MLAAAKIHALQKAAGGDILTGDEEAALLECIEDYRKRLKLGNGFKLTMPDIVEAFEILFDDVQFMTGDRRKAAIRLLQKAGARGFQVGDIPISYESPDDDNAEGFRVKVTDGEKLDALLAMESEERKAS